MVDGPEVLLGDIARIEGPECALKDDLARTNITRAPRPGRTRNVRRSYVEYRLRTSGLPADQYDVFLQDNVVVTRQSQTIEKAWVRQVVETYLRSTPPYSENPHQILKIRTGRLPDLPAGELGYRVSSSSSPNPEHFSLTIFPMVDGREEGRVRASVEVDLKVRAVVAARRLEAGHRIQPGDLELTVVSMDQLKRGALTTLEQAEGLSCRRQILPASPWIETTCKRCWWSTEGIR